MMPGEKGTRTKKSPLDRARAFLPKRTSLYELMMGESRVWFRWRSSLWKLLWKELVIYLMIFFMITILYRLVLKDEEQRETLERIIRWLNKHSAGLPLTFILGFYVSMVVKRWWDQYCKLPWPDTIAIHLRALLPGISDGPRMVRRTIIRYCILSYVLCIRRMSSRLRRRFPAMQEIVRTGLARPDEAARIGEEDLKAQYDSNWWMPMRWCVELASQAHQKGLVVSEPGYAHLAREIANFRTNLTEVATYGDLPVPLVYTQVVTLAVYIYFFVELLGSQWTPKSKKGDDEPEIDLYFPVFLIIKFLFYAGWLRVAETLYNPFGEDDDDFELNSLLDRHFRVAMSIVNQDQDPPELRRDLFWGQAQPELSLSSNFPLDKLGGDETGAEEGHEMREDRNKLMANSEKRDPMA